MEQIPMDLVRMCLHGIAAPLAWRGERSSAEWTAAATEAPRLVEGRECRLDEGGAGRREDEEGKEWSRVRG